MQSLQASRYTRLSGVLQDDAAGSDNLVHFAVGLAQDAGNARVRVQHVHCRVALHVQHVLEAEPARQRMPAAQLKLPTMLHEAPLACSGQSKQFPCNQACSGAGGSVAATDMSWQALSGHCSRLSRACAAAELPQTRQAAA